jgi:hypothetical protein
VCNPQDAWAFFDAETKQRHREETLAAFAGIRRMLVPGRVAPDE